MKKNNGKNSKNKKTLKKLKEDLSLFYETKKYSKALKISKKITELYPKNTFGYLEYIKIKTNFYTKYIDEKNQKKIKKMFEKLYDISSKKQKEKFKVEFDEYINDCKETYNLIKIKKDIIGKSFLRQIYEEYINHLDKKNKDIKSIYYSNISVKCIYDLIKGLFFVGCLLFNIFNPNKLLIITIPFGIFGFITIYSVIEIMFFGKNRKKEGLEKVDSFINENNCEIENCKEEIKKIESLITFLNEQKINSQSKIPRTFNEQINLEFNNLDDVDSAVKSLISKLNGNKTKELCLMIDDYTNIDSSKFVNDIIEAEKKEKEKNKENFNMQKITKVNILSLIILSIASIVSLALVINNFSKFNFLSFVIATVVGITSNLIYNIQKGRHTKLTDTFNDILCISVFRTSLVYNLIYLSLNNEFDFFYNFIQIPFTFLFIFIGFIMIISIFKYKNLYKKLME